MRVEVVYNKNGIPHRKLGEGLLWVGKTRFYYLSGIAEPFDWIVFKFVSEPIRTEEIGYSDHFLTEIPIEYLLTHESRCVRNYAMRFKDET